MPPDNTPQPGMEIGMAEPAAFAKLLKMAGHNQSGDDTAMAALALWDSLANHLAAIIGEEGFNALFSRSLHLAGAAHPWLAEALLTRGNVPRFAALKALLEGRTQEEVSTGMALLFFIFTNLLSTLIGKQLTTNILRAAWGDAYTQAALETSPWPTK